jgi:hypothetical protein
VQGTGLKTREISAATELSQVPDQLSFALFENLPRLSHADVEGTGRLVDAPTFVVHLDEYLAMTLRKRSNHIYDGLRQKFTGALDQQATGCHGDSPLIP